MNAGKRPSANKVLLSSLMSRKKVVKVVGPEYAHKVAATR